MSFLKKMRGKGRSKNHQELHFKASVPSPTVECAKKWSVEEKETKSHRERSPINIGM